MQKMFFSQKFDPLSIFMFNKLDNYNPVITPLSYFLFLFPYSLFFYSTAKNGKYFQPLNPRSKLNP
jgi:hypothetical protein